MKSDSGYPASEENSKIDIRTEMVDGSGENKPRRPYRKDKTLPNKIIEYLVDYCSAERTAKLLDVSPSQVHRYKSIALRLGIIVPFCGKNPRLYDKGPRYALRREQGWWSSEFEPVECRVHKGHGSSYICYVDAKDVGYFDELPFNQGDGTVLFLPLFKGRTHHPGYTLHKARMPIPASILGYDGSVYLEARRRKDGSVVLYISPPEVRLTFQALEEDADGDPFLLVIAYIENIFQHHGHWNITEFKDIGPTHYAVDLEKVNLYCPELATNVPRLKKGDNEEDLVLFIDKSIPKGELETVSPRIARDILCILEVERRRANGDIRTPIPGLLRCVE